MVTQTKSTQSKNVLKRFVQEKSEDNTQSGKFKKIRTSECLVDLTSFYSYSHEKSPIRGASVKRMEIIADKALAKYTDVYKLAEFYRLCGVDRFPFLTEKLFKRMGELYPSDLEALFVVRTGIVEKCTDSHNALINHIEDRIIEAVKIHKKVENINFLLDTWWRMSKRLEGNKKIARLMHKALTHEDNLTRLFKLVERTRTDWNHYDNDACRAVKLRINDVVGVLYLKTEDIPTLEFYRSKSCIKETIELIDGKLARIAEKKIARLTNVQSILNTTKLFNLNDEERSLKTRKSFRDRIDVVIVGHLKKCKTADKVYPYLVLTSEVEKAYKKTQARFMELIPAFFDGTNKKGNLKTAIKWWGLCEGSKGWRKTMKRLIDNEEDIIYISSIVYNSYLKSYQSLFEKRICKYISGLTKQNKFFTDCVYKGRFFGNKALFKRKAEQFVK